VGRPFPEELFLEEERDRAHALFRSARSGAPTEPCEMHWVSRDGKRHRIAWTATTLADAMGEVSFVITTGVDVTEQREAEAALRSSEARYRQLVEGSLGMVCTHDLEGRLLSINTHAAENLGYKPEELIGQSMYGYIQDEHKHGWDSYWQAMAEHGEDQGLLYLKKKDGSPCVIAFRNKLLNVPGTPPFVLGHGIDITEKTDAENKLHALMRQRESILESVGDGIYGMDMEGCILFVNHVGAHMLGFEPEELEGKAIHPLIHHSRADGTPYPREECPIQKTRHRHTAIRVLDEVFWRKDGTYIPVEYVACPLVANGNVTGVVVAFQDVTERRRLDRMKDEFISTVSHELRTPLTSLRAALGLIAGGKLDQRPEKAGQMLEVAMANCDRLVRLVNDILDFERISNDKLRLECTEINAVDLLRRVAELQHSSAQNAGLTVLVDAEPVELWADNDRLVQTLTNLLSNAIKFSPPGSKIKLLARPLNESEALIEVRDEGRGIPAEKLDMIFERFQQIDASDSRDMGGTGLGLAICRSIVRQHGGRIWAESTVGKGSSFFLSLPRRAATALVHDGVS
jgi:two-component system sensor histidine kinase VicK